MVEHRSPKPGVGSSSLSSRANITYAELTSSAVAVLYASLLIALVVFVMDFCFQNIMEFVYPH